MDINFDERLALPANLRRLGDRRAFDLDQRDRLRLLRRQQGEQLVDAEPCMDRLVLRPDRGVIVAPFGLVALAAQHVDPAIAGDHGEPGPDPPPALPGTAPSVASRDWLTAGTDE